MRFITLLHSKVKALAFPKQDVRTCFLQLCIVSHVQLNKSDKGHWEGLQLQLYLTLVTLSEPHQTSLKCWWHWPTFDDMCILQSVA